MPYYLSWLVVSSVLGITQLFSIGGFGVTPLEFSLVGIFGIAAYRWLWLAQPIRLPRSYEVLGIVAILGAVTISAAGVVLDGSSPVVTQTLKTYAHFIYLWMVGLVFLCIPISAEDWIRALRVHFVIATVVMVYGLYQLPARVFDWPLAWIDVSNVSFTRGLSDDTEVGQIALKFQNFYRATSIFSEPSSLSGYATATLVMLIVPYFRGTASIIRQRWWFWTVIVLSVLSIFLAFSITGLLLLSAALLAMVVAYPRESARRLAIVGVCSLVFVGVADRAVEAVTNISVIELFGQRLQSYVSGAAADDELGTIAGDSFSQRLQDYQTALVAWEDAPVTGVGPGSFAESAAGRQYSQPFLSTLIGSVLVEFGLIGFVLIIGGLVGFLIRSWIVERQWTKQHRGRDLPEEQIASFIPFRWLLIVLTTVTGNFLITPAFWFDVAMLLTMQMAVLRKMGEGSWVEFTLGRSRVEQHV